MFRKFLLLMLTLMLGASLVITAAQEPAATEDFEPAATEDFEPASTEEFGPAPSSIDAELIVADGLNNPRHMSFGSDGTLYVAEAGVGGDADVQGPYGPNTAGLTGQISAISPDGQRTVVVSGLVSLNQGFGRIDGATDVLVTDDSYWVVLGTGPQESLEGTLSEAVVQINRETGEVMQSIDLRAFELASNPDTGEEIISNPADLALGADGTLYIVDASGNSLFTWTEAAGLQLLVAWPVTDENDPPQSVPTSVSVGADGDLYVGFLSGFPFPTGGARIERYSADGTLKETYEGLTLVTDVLAAADGTVYAVEMASGFGDTGYIANSGRVVAVKDGVITPIAEGLNYPYGIAQNADGQLIVTVDSALVPPDSGKVIIVAGA
jgi:hypothetical protein